MAQELESQVTVVLLNWKRLANNVKIVTSLVGSNDIAEIRIWNNNPDVKLTIEVCLLSWPALEPTKDQFGMASPYSTLTWLPP